MEERREFNKNLEVVLARLDERTKYIKARMDEHVASQCESCKLNGDVSVLKTNVMWIKRISIAIPGLVLTCVGIWKGLVQ